MNIAYIKEQTSKLIRAFGVVIFLRISNYLGHAITLAMIGICNSERNVSSTYKIRDADTVHLIEV
jgi:hypothetical protein